MSESNNYCSICGRSESVTGKQIKIQFFSVCPDCMQKTMDQMNSLSDSDIFNAFTGMGMPYGQPNNKENEMEDQAEEESVNLNQNSEKAEETAESAELMETDDGDQSKEIKEKSDNSKENKNTGKKPNVRFINIGDIQSLFRQGPEVKPKKKSKKNYKEIENINDIPKPHIIKQRLDDYVVGQEQAKKVLSVAVYNHYKRILWENENIREAEEKEKTEKTDDAILESGLLADGRKTEIEKSNVLMLGPTGSGKTYLVKTLAKILNVPLAITDATSLTEAGYIGDDIESVVSKLLAEADNDVEKAEKGIIFIDEIDKIAKKKNAHARDVSGESVQQGMLKLLEGSDVEVPVGANSKNAMVPLETINTRNILFICGGAFPDMDEIIKKRLSKSSSIGYSATLKDAYDDDKNILNKVTAEDLREFGLIPEFIGRLPIVFALENLTADMLISILKEPKNAILKQYEELLKMDEVKLEFTEAALKEIAEKALKNETGARALRAIIEEIMLDIMYEVPKDKNIGRVVITENYVKGTGGPEIYMRGQEERIGQ